MMTYLELAPAITAIRSRPEEFEFANDTLHHARSRHRFRFVSEDDMQIHADCDCSFLRASREQTRVFHAAYQEWHASYWRPLQINREFASHFAPPPVWRRVAIWLLRRLLSWPEPASSPALQTALSLQPAR
jgi:hypothetical protein